MLFISRIVGCRVQFIASAFQSRNRDAFHFKDAFSSGGKRVKLMFQSRNRDAFHFKILADMLRSWYWTVSISESRCFSFQVITNDSLNISPIMFQSRNRDAFHFK